MSGELIGAGRCLVTNDHSIDEASDRLAADALEVDMSALRLLLLPGHVDERTLGIVVDDWQCKYKCTTLKNAAKFIMMRALLLLLLL